MIDGFVYLIGHLRPMALVKWAAFLVIPAALWIVLHLATLHTYIQARERLNDYRSEVQRLERTQVDLQREQAQLKAGGFTTEKTIRERLRMIKPGDKVIFIDPSTPTATTTPPSDPSSR